IRTMKIRIYLIYLHQRLLLYFRNNIMISDENRSLNRQMIINGPQGGFQNIQPRVLGGTIANL
ncbi:hypothetical protein NAI31_12380, partial [Francisella tularensis subsp. holarctica]|nr:hypothetical protein [Francisella tularensis subsp. holarctica]